MALSGARLFLWKGSVLSGFYPAEAVRRPHQGGPSVYQSHTLYIVFLRRDFNTFSIRDRNDLSRAEFHSSRAIPYHSLTPAPGLMATPADACMSFYCPPERCKQALGSGQLITTYGQSLNHRHKIMLLPGYCKLFLCAVPVHKLWVSGAEFPDSPGLLQRPIRRGYRADLCS